MSAGQYCKENGGVTESALRWWRNPCAEVCIRVKNNGLQRGGGIGVKSCNVRATPLAIWWLNSGERSVWRDDNDIYHALMCSALWRSQKVIKLWHVDIANLAMKYICIILISWSSHSVQTLSILGPEKPLSRTGFYELAPRAVVIMLQLSFLCAQLL